MAVLLASGCAVAANNFGLASSGQITTCYITVFLESLFYLPLLNLNKIYRRVTPQSFPLIILRKSVQVNL